MAGAAPVLPGTATPVILPKAPSVLPSRTVEGEEDQKKVIRKRAAAAAVVKKRRTIDGGYSERVGWIFHTQSPREALDSRSHIPRSVPLRSVEEEDKRWWIQRKSWLEISYTESTGGIRFQESHT